MVASAHVPRTSRLRVNPSDVTAAHQVVRELDGVERVAFDNARPGDLDLQLAADETTPPSSRVLSAIIAAGIEIRSFETERVSLNDAFLSLTADHGGAS